MVPVLVETLLLAAAGILSFGNITLVILMLISDRGWVNGLAYALGYSLARDSRICSDRQTSWQRAPLFSGLQPP